MSLGLNEGPGAPSGLLVEMPSNGLALVGGAGSGSLATLILNWLLTLGSAPVDPSFVCQPVVDAAIASVSASVGAFESSASFWERFTTLPDLEGKVYSFLLGAVVGFGFFFAVDLIHAFKVWWFRFVGRLEAAGLPLVHRHPLLR